MMFVRRVARALPPKFGVYPSFSIASSIRLRVPSATRSGVLMAREIVDGETPAASATSSSVGGVEDGFMCGKHRWLARLMYTTLAHPRANA